MWNPFKSNAEATDLLDAPTWRLAGDIGNAAAILLFAAILGTRIRR